VDEKQEVRRQFGKSAENYVDSPVHAKGQDLAWVREIVFREAPEHSLDIATGAGHTAFVLSEASRRVTALDLTPEMLAVAETEAKKRNLDNIVFVQGDAEALPFPDGQFDLVACRIAAHHFPDVAAAVQEMHRVLKDQGWLLLIDNVVPDDPESADLLNRIEKLRDPSHQRCLSIAEWNRLLTGAGFREVDGSRTWTTPMHIPGWLDRINTPTERRRVILELLSQAGSRPWFDADGETVILQKVMWVCRK
jgi:ubiquinone/menaquinone biosynthesis C-methylase UbiE